MIDDLSRHIKIQKQDRLQYTDFIEISPYWPYSVDLNVLLYFSYYNTHTRIPTPLSYLEGIHGTTDWLIFNPEIKITVMILLRDNTVIVMPANYHLPVSVTVFPDAPISITSSYSLARNV